MSEDNKIRNKKEDITTNNKNMQSIVRKFYKQLNAKNGETRRKK